MNNTYLWLVKKIILYKVRSKSGDIGDRTSVRMYIISVVFIFSHISYERKKEYYPFEGNTLKLYFFCFQMYYNGFLKVLLSLSLPTHSCILCKKNIFAFLLIYPHLCGKMYI